MKNVIIGLLALASVTAYAGDVSDLFGDYTLVKANVHSTPASDGRSPCPQRMSVHSSDSAQIIVGDIGFNSINDGKQCHSLNSSYTFGGVECEKNTYAQGSLKNFSCIREFLSGLNCLLSAKPTYKAELKEGEKLMFTGNFPNGSHYYYTGFECEYSRD